MSPSVQPIQTASLSWDILVMVCNGAHAYTLIPMP